jgi:hypothetical protein
MGYQTCAPSSVPPSAYDLVLLAKGDTVVQDMIDRISENGKILWNGTECGID